jgi:hypothetical protein
VRFLRGSLADILNLVADGLMLWCSVVDAGEHIVTDLAAKSNTGWCQRISMRQVK